MGLIPPPISLTKEEFIKANGLDTKFENWLKYDINPFIGMYYFIKEKFLE